MIEKMVEEHEAIKSKIQYIAESATYEDLQRLAHLVTYHIRFEERILFREIEKVATQEQLQRLMEAEKMHSCDISIWEDEFWKNPIANSSSKASNAGL